MKHRISYYDCGTLRARFRGVDAQPTFDFLYYKQRDTTNAFVERGFAEQVKLAGQETFVPEVSRLLARSRRRIHGDWPTTNFPIGLCELNDLMYTTGLPRNVPNHRNRGGTSRVVYDELFDDSCDQAGGDLSNVRS